VFRHKGGGHNPTSLPGCSGEKESAAPALLREKGRGRDVCHCAGAVSRQREIHEGKRQMTSQNPATKKRGERGGGREVSSLRHGGVISIDTHENFRGERDRSRSGATLGA